MLDGLTYDTRHAWRALLRHPAFAVTASISLALGLAATTTMFGIIDAVDLRSLPYPHAERLMVVRLKTAPNDTRCPACPRFTPPVLFEAEASSGVFEHLSSYKSHSYTLAGVEESKLLY